MTCWRSRPSCRWTAASRRSCRLTGASPTPSKWEPWPAMTGSSGTLPALGEQWGIVDHFKIAYAAAVADDNCFLCVCSWQLPSGKKTSAHRQSPALQVRGLFWFYLNLTRSDFLFFFIFWHRSTLLLPQVVPSKREPLCHHWMSREDLQSAPHSPSWPPTGQQAFSFPPSGTQIRLNELYSSLSLRSFTDTFTQCLCSQWQWDRPTSVPASAGTGRCLYAWSVVTGNYVFGWLKCRMSVIV